MTEFSAPTRLNLKARLAGARLSAAYAPLTDLLETLGILTVLGVGAVYIASQDLTVGGLHGFAAYLGFLYPPLKNLGQLTLTVTSATASSERLAELLNTPPRVSDAPYGRTAPAMHGHLRMDGVDFGYPDTDRRVLTDLTLTADPGELLLITGASGAGKSSVAKLLLRFYDPTRGRITLDGVDLREYSLPALRASITLLLQETLLVDGTIADNIAFGSPAATRRDIRAAAAVAGAEEFIAALPDGYATPVGQRGRRLSGGQRQRIAIARAHHSRRPPSRARRAHHGTGRPIRRRGAAATAPTHANPHHHPDHPRPTPRHRCQPDPGARPRSPRRAGHP